MLLPDIDQSGELTLQKGGSLTTWPEFLKCEEGPRERSASYLLAIFEIPGVHISPPAQSSQVRRDGRPEVTFHSDQGKVSIDPFHKSSKI